MVQGGRGLGGVVRGDRGSGGARPGHGGEQFGRGAPVEYGECLDGRPLRPVERGELVEDHRDGPAPGHRSPVGARVGEGPVVERVAEADGVDLPVEAGRQPGDEPLSAVARCQRPEDEPGELSRVGGTGEDGGERGRGLALAAGENEQDGRAERMPEEMVDERDGGGVGGVEVVECEDEDGPVRRKPPERRRDAPDPAGLAATGPPTPLSTARSAGGAEAVRGAGGRGADGGRRSRLGRGARRVVATGRRRGWLDEFREGRQGRGEGAFVMVQVREGVREGLEGRARVPARRTGEDRRAAEDRRVVTDR